jgi:hypothetical protein
MGGIPFKIDPKTILQMSNDFIIASRIPGWEQYIAKMPTAKPVAPQAPSAPIAPPAAPAPAPVEQV